jgi:hypothetical protein
MANDGVSELLMAMPRVVFAIHGAVVIRKKL